MEEGLYKMEIEEGTLKKKKTEKGL